MTFLWDAPYPSSSCDNQDHREVGRKGVLVGLVPIKTQRDEAPTINLTPMIDVVFLLIIFLMVATRFTEIEKNIQFHLPQVLGATAMTRPPRNRVVQVDRNGSLTMDRQPITIDALTHQLTEARTEYPQLGVVIRGDAGVRYQRVAEVLAACNRAGIAELGISVRIGAVDARETPGSLKQKPGRT